MKQEIGDPLQGYTADSGFFEAKTPEMAWVLGLIFSDGCIHEKPPAVSLSQKDPEIIEKSLRLLNSLVSMRFRPRRGHAGELYSWTIHDSRILRSLRDLGLAPRKSLTVEYPYLPSTLDSHFLRGYWDGDGTIFKEKARGCWKAGLISGSREFIDQALNVLERHGFRRPTVYKDSRGNGASHFRFSGAAVSDLAFFLYREATRETLLLRKFEAFRQATLETLGPSAATKLDEDLLPAKPPGRSNSPISRTHRLGRMYQYLDSLNRSPSGGQLEESGSKAETEDGD